MLPGALLDRGGFAPALRRAAFGVLLRLDPGFNDVHRTCHHACHSTGGRRGQDLQSKTDIPRSHPLDGHPVLLFVERELQGREREVAEDGRLISVEQRGNAFLSNDRAESVRGRSVVVSRIEEGVVVASLQLHPSLQYFRGDVDDGSGEVGKETWQQVRSAPSALNAAHSFVIFLTSGKIGEVRIDPRVQHPSLCEFINTKEGHRSRERAEESRRHTTVEASKQTFLSIDGRIRRGHGCVFRRDMRIALLSRLHRV